MLNVGDALDNYVEELIGLLVSIKFVTYVEVGKYWKAPVWSILNVDLG